MKYPYLKNKQFLRDFDRELFYQQFIKIEVLDFKTEKHKAFIEGKCTGGSCNLSGTSSMRRSASCSLVVDPEGIEINGYQGYQQYNDISEIKNLLSMNKKVKIEVGFINTLFYAYPEYEEYDKIWFPLGTYVIKNANISKNNSGVNISLTLNDKSSLLNGDMGGTFPSAIVFSELDTFSKDGLSKETEYLLIKDIIKQIVINFGGESPDNIIISDIDDYIVRVVKWSNNKNDARLIVTNTKEKLKIKLSTESTEENGVEYYDYQAGDNIGYTAEPFTYPGTLECKAGESVASILDKIKNVLGNFEWFYDSQGRFVFQKIKNYLNESLSKNILELQSSDYLSVFNPNKLVSEYVFNDEVKHLITSISNSPQYPNVKNDFTVWGTKKTASGANKPIRYHVAFDAKPQVDKEKKRLALVCKKDYNGLQSIVFLVNGENFSFNKENREDIYYIDSSSKIIYKYKKDAKVYESLGNNYELCYLKNSGEWRTELYYLGLEQSKKSFYDNPYAAELNAEWPKIWDALKIKKADETIDGLSVYEGGYYDTLNIYDYDYWLDFLESDPNGNQNLTKFNINNIGRRAKVVSENSINCLFTQDVPNYIYIEANGNIEMARKAADFIGKKTIQVDPDVFRHLTTGGSQNSAFEKIKELIYQHTSYNENINLSTIPIYHLEPNTRITVYDKDVAVSGDYLIKTMSIPLGINGTSTISATRCLERTI